MIPYYGLVEEAIADPVLGGQRIAYTYDAVGNRRTHTTPAGTTTYTYDANDRLVAAGSTSYAYDANGNMLQALAPGRVTRYTYDIDNRLTGVQTPEHVVQYAYNADGIRWSASVDGVVTHYVVDTHLTFAQVLEERDARDVLLAQYTHGGTLLSQTRQGHVSYYHVDGLGSTRLLTDGTGTITDTYTYDAFGALRGRTGGTADTILFGGEDIDPQTALYYLRARYYHPHLGRFLGQDPARGNPFTPTSLHGYLSANNNPLMFRDPSGQTATTIGEVLTASLIKAALSTTLVGAGIALLADSISNPRSRGCGAHPSILYESARAVAFRVGESGLRICRTGTPSRLDASDGLGHALRLVGVRFGRRQGGLLGQRVRVHDHTPERLEGDPSVTLLPLHTPHDALAVRLPEGRLPGAARLFEPEGPDALLRPPRFPCLAHRTGAWDQRHAPHPLLQAQPQRALTVRWALRHHTAYPIASPRETCLERAWRLRALAPGVISHTQAP